ncbi:hypothetical protein VTO42DRAFT_3980 [Malbranchea cinnamomea]
MASSQSMPIPAVSTTIAIVSTSNPIADSGAADTATQQQHRPYPPSELLSNLIPALAVAVYVVFGLYRLHLVLSRRDTRGFLSWSSSSRSLFAGCVRQLAYLRRAKPKRRGWGRGRGYVTEDVDGSDDDDIERRRLEEEWSQASTTEDDADDDQSIKLQPQRRTSYSPQLENIRIRGSESNVPPCPKSTSDSQAQLVAEEPSVLSRRKKPAPLRLQTHHVHTPLPASSGDSDSDNAGPNASALGITRYFDPQTGHLKDYIILRPSTGLEALSGSAEGIPCPGSGRDVKGWAEWIIDRAVAWAQGWLDDKSGGDRHGYRVVSMEDHTNDDGHD